MSDWNTKFPDVRIFNESSDIGIEFTGRVSRSPYSGTVYAAELPQLPLLEATDLQKLAEIETSARQPVLVCWSQHYRLLAELVLAARLHLTPAPLVLIRHTAANHVVPLPGELLAEDVLLTTNPRALVPGLRRGGWINILTIEDSLRRDGFEPGTNDLTITVYGNQSSRVFMEFLRNTPLVSCMDGIQENCLVGSA